VSLALLSATVSPAPYFSQGTPEQRLHTRWRSRWE
jgi:hypothetical protein